jgi:hypothetical protein
MNGSKQMTLHAHAPPTKVARVLLLRLLLLLLLPLLPLHRHRGQRRLARLCPPSCPGQPSQGGDRGRCKQRCCPCHAQLGAITLGWLFPKVEEILKV